MGIKLGNLDISSFKVGSVDCTIYLGETLVFEPTQPTPSLKFSASYSDGTSYSEECDGDSTLTSATTKPSGYEASGMTSAVVGNCVTSINNKAFQRCTSLSSVTIPSSVTNIGSYAFSNCSSVINIEIPSGITNINGNTFYNCKSLTSITIPSSVTSIGMSSFAGCTSLSSVTIPSSVTSIGGQAFANCSGLTNCIIGSGVTSIGIWGFQNCTSLSSIIIESTTPPTLELNAFQNTNNCPIYVPAASVDAFKSASGWSDYTSRLQAIPNS